MHGTCKAGSGGHVDKIALAVNASSIMTSVPITGSVSHPNGGRDSGVFFTLQVISDCCSGQDEIEFTATEGAELEGRGELDVRATEKSLNEKLV